MKKKKLWAFCYLEVFSLKFGILKRKWLERVDTIVVFFKKNKQKIIFNIHRVNGQLQERELFVLTLDVVAWCFVGQCMKVIFRWRHKEWRQWYDETWLLLSGNLILSKASVMAFEDICQCFSSFRNLTLNENVLWWHFRNLRANLHCS